MTEYYLYVENNEIISSGYQPMGDSFISIEVSKELHDDYVEHRNKYLYSDGQIVINPNYEQEEAEKERQRLDALTLTPADVERALYKAKNMDFDDLQGFIAIYMPTMDIKALKIEFRAKDFYRGATLEDGTRLFDAIGALLGYSSEDMDYLFLNKELPNKDELLNDDEIPF